MDKERFVCHWELDALAPGATEFLRLRDEHAPAEAEFIVEELALRPGQLILDVACGLGRHAIELAAKGLRVVGVDLAAPFLQEAARAARVRGLRLPLVRADARSLPFRGQADAVISIWISALTEMPNDVEELRIVRSLAGALKPGGRILLTTWNAFRAVNRKMVTDLTTMRTELRYRVKEHEGEIVRYVRPFFPSELGLAFLGHGVRTEALYGIRDDDPWTDRCELTEEHGEYMFVGTKVG
jgi:SAM-dependent methyltransferase